MAELNNNQVVLTTTTLPTLNTFIVGNRKIDKTLFENALLLNMLGFLSTYGQQWGAKRTALVQLALSQMIGDIHNNPDSHIDLGGTLYGTSLTNNGSDDDPVAYAAYMIDLVANAMPDIQEAPKKTYGNTDFLTHFVLSNWNGTPDPETWYNLDDVVTDKSGKQSRGYKNRLNIFNQFLNKEINSLGDYLDAGDAYGNIDTVRERMLDLQNRLADGNISNEDKLAMERLGFNPAYFDENLPTPTTPTDDTTLQLTATPTVTSKPKRAVFQPGFIDPYSSEFLKAKAALGGKDYKSIERKIINGKPVYVGHYNRVYTRKKTPAELAAQVNLGLDKYQIAGQRQLSKTGLSGSDYARLASLAQDVAATGVSFFGPYGTAASGILGTTSALTDLGADIADPSVSKGQVIKNLGANMGLAALGLLPGGRSVSTIKKLAKYAPLVLNASNVAFNKDIHNSWSKLTDPKLKITEHDYQNILYSIKTVLGGAQGTRYAYKQYKYGKLTGSTPKGSTKYLVKHNLTTPATEEGGQSKTTPGNSTISKALLDKINKSRTLDEANKAFLDALRENGVLNPEQYTLGEGNFSLTTHTGLKGKLASTAHNITSGEKVKGTPITEERTPTTVQHAVAMARLNEILKLRHPGRFKVLGVPLLMRTDYDVHANGKAPIVIPEFNIKNPIKTRFDREERKTRFDRQREEQAALNQTLQSSLNLQTTQLNTTLSSLEHQLNTLPSQNSQQSLNLQLLNTLTLNNLLNTQLHLLTSQQQSTTLQPTRQLQLLAQHLQLLTNAKQKLLNIIQGSNKAEQLRLQALNAAETHGGTNHKYKKDYTYNRNGHTIIVDSSGKAIVTTAKRKNGGANILGNVNSKEVQNKMDDILSGKVKWNADKEDWVPVSRYGSKLNLLYKYLEGGHIVKGLLGLNTRHLTDLKLYNYTPEHDTDWGNILYGANDLGNYTSGFAYGNSGRGNGMIRYKTDSKYSDYSDKGKTYATNVENSLNYDNFTNALLNSYDEYIKDPANLSNDKNLFYKWANLVDKRLPQGSLSTFFNNGKLRNNWNVTNWDSYGRNTIQNYTDGRKYLAHLRRDQLLADRHNDLLREGKRYWYKGSDGQRVYVDPNDINGFNVSKDATDDILGNTLWHDYELTENPNNTPLQNGNGVNGKEPINKLKPQIDWDELAINGLGLTRMLGDIASTNRRSDNLRKDMRLNFILNPKYQKEITDYYAGNQFVANLAALLRNIGSKAVTSDANFNTAKNLEYLNKADQAEQQLAVRNQNKIQEDLAQAENLGWKNSLARVQTANTNGDRMAEFANTLAQLRMQKDAANRTSVDNWTMELEYNLKNKHLERKNIRDLFNANQLGTKAARVQYRLTNDPLLALAMYEYLLATANSNPTNEDVLKLRKLALKIQTMQNNIQLEEGDKWDRDFANLYGLRYNGNPYRRRQPNVSTPTYVAKNGGTLTDNIKLSEKRQARDNDRFMKSIWKAIDLYLQLRK